MNIRCYSDVHLDHEFDIHDFKFSHENFLKHWNLFWQPPVTEYDKEDILILNGDIAHSQLTFITDENHNPNPWLKNLSERFKHVIIVFGNHDYWGCDIETAILNAKCLISELGNVSILDNDVLIIDDMKFVGPTLWTDLSKTGLYRADQVMNDYVYISHDNSSTLCLRPEYIQTLHTHAIEFLKENAVRDYPEQKLIVITHHSPTNASTFRGKYRNLYVTPIEDILKNADVVCFGHTHEYLKTRINNTLYYSNARGYVGGYRQNQHFDEMGMIEI